MQGSLSKAPTFVLVAAMLTVLAFSSPEVYSESADHMTSDQSHLPTANIGDRQASLEFHINPEVASPADPLDVTISRIDAKTGKNIPHVTYTISIADGQGKQVFSEIFHGHDGKVSARFLYDDSRLTRSVETMTRSLQAMSQTLVR